MTGMIGELLPLMEGAENAVRFLGIRGGQEVLIGCTPSTDPNGLSALSGRIRAQGARVSIFMAEDRPVNQAEPRPLLEAIKACDYYVDMGAGPDPHARSMYIPMFDYGVPMARVSGARGFLASEAARYPMELWCEIHNRLKWRVCGDEVDPGRNVTFRVSDNRGNELSYRVKCPENIGAYIGDEPLNAGFWGGSKPKRVISRSTFPPRNLTMGDLQHSAEGALYVDATSYFGKAAEPWRCVFRQGYCTHIEGGRDARRAWEMTLGKYPNGNRLREVAINITPKMVAAIPEPAIGTPVPLTRLLAGGLGTVLLAFGGDTGVGGVDPGFEYTTTLFTNTYGSTVTVDDVPIVEDGRLLILEDPELREFAQQFGDPDYLLSGVDHV